MKPDRDVRPFQDVLLDLGARLGLPGMVTSDGAPKFPGGYPDYIVNHERRPGIGSLAGFRGANGDEYARGAPNPRQLERYMADGSFHVHHLPAHMRYFKHVNRDYIDWAVDKGFRLTHHAGDLPALQRADAEDAAGGAGARAPCSRRSSIASASTPISIRCPSGIRRSRTAPPDAQLPAARHHAAADGDVPLVGLAERVAAGRSTAPTGCS